MEVQPNENGYGGSGCLSIVSRSQKSWSISPDVYIEVASGTTIFFEAILKKDFQEQTAGLRLEGFDRYKQPLDIPLPRVEAAGPHGQWEPLGMTVNIPAGISYITPRIRGTGMGKTRVDNIKVSRQSGATDVTFQTQ